MCRMYRWTSDTSYLNFAEKVFRFWDENFVNQTSGQVCDGIGPDGKYHWDIWTYNQGMYVEAATCLFLATNDTSYLTKAKLVSQFVVKQETTDDLVLREQSPCKYDDMDCLEFKARDCRFLEVSQFRSGNNSSISVPLCKGDKRFRRDEGAFKQCGCHYEEHSPERWSFGSP